MTNFTPTELDEIHEFKETLKRQLTNEWPYRRTPNGFQNTLNEARNASQHLTARIFHDIGLQAWLAYFLVNHRTTRHFQGQGALRKSIATLQELPIEEKKSIAYELTRVVPHDTIRKVLEQLLRAEKHPCDESEDLLGTNKRHADHVGGMLHISPATRSTTGRFSNETLNEIQMARETTSESTLYNRSESGHTIFEPVADRVPDGAAAGLSGQQTVSNPSADRLARVFPQYTCGAVRNSGGTASITMTFPAQLSGPKVECLMSLSILPNKIQYLAMELFGVHVESDTGLWYITLDNGVRVLPQYEVVLQGGKEKGIEKLLGSEPSLALKKSPLRKEEVRQGKLRTNCVTLRLASNCDFDGILNLNLGLDEAFRLKDALFK